MNGSYIQRNVDAVMFEDFKKLSQPFINRDLNVIVEPEELDIDECLVFSIYDKLDQNQDRYEELDEFERFRSTLTEIVDALYTGPAVDYVVLKLDKNL